MQKQDFETYQKTVPRFQDPAKFSETHVFRGTIRHPSHSACLPCKRDDDEADDDNDEHDAYNDDGSQKRISILI